MSSSKKSIPDIRIIDPIDNPDNDNVDVEVKLPNGNRFIGTFFTIANIQTLMKRWKTTGECAGGAYFWTADMIIVERLDEETIRRAVIDLAENEELESVFMAVETNEAEDDEEEEDEWGG